MSAFRVPARVGSETDAPPRIVWADVLVTLGVLAAALVVRAASVIRADFPLNDGGLFLAMTAEIERNGWSLPATVTWNGREIPFAYPPLGLYLTGLITAAFGIDILVVMRVLPLVLSTVAAAVVFAIGRTLLTSRSGAAAAGLTYAFAPAAFTWAIAGGGVTRSPGMVLALTTIWLSLRLLARPTLGMAALLGLVAGATILTHPASAIFAGASSVLIVVAYSLSHRPPKSREGVPNHPGRIAFAAVGTACLIVLPWAVTVLAQHGLGVFIEVASNGPDPDVALITLAAGRVTGIGTDPLGLAIIGVTIVSVLRARILLPAWLLASSFLGVQYAIVPASLLVGSLVVDGIDLARSSEIRHQTIGRAALGVLAVLLVIEATVGVQASNVETSHLHALGVDRREAMRWMALNTPEGSTVLVVTGDHWSTDPDSEWFFVLAERQSIATVQGHEWLGREAYARASDRYERLQRCTASVSCLELWLQDEGADYLFIPKGQRHGPSSPVDCCLGIRDDIVAGDSYSVVYDMAGATIVRLREPSAGVQAPWRRRSVSAADFSASAQWERPPAPRFGTSREGEHRPNRRLLV